MLCPKCGNTNFNLEEDYIYGENYILVTCYKCHSTVGIYPNPQSLLEKMEELKDKIEDLESRISDLEG